MRQDNILRLCVPVHDGRQIHKATGHGDIGDISGPDLIGPVNAQIPKKIGIDAMLGMRTTGVWLGIDRFDAH